MFNSPMDYCPRCRQYVALDQAPLECAAQYHCGGVPCPLERYFAPPAATTGKELKPEEATRPGDGHSSTSS